MFKLGLMLIMSATNWQSDNSKTVLNMLIVLVLNRTKGGKLKWKFPIHFDFYFTCK